MGMGTDSSGKIVTYAARRSSVIEDREKERERVTEAIHENIAQRQTYIV